MNKIDVVLGLQWGDEGKGKMVDVLTPGYKIVARFQGGPNAGHSLVFGNESFVLHTVPSGIFREDTANVIGNGVVIDPTVLMEEIRAIEAMGVSVPERLLVSKRAHLILPTHRMLDAASESALGKGKIGSTLRGIGPAYADKTGRYGLRAGDLLLPDFKVKYNALKERHLRQLSGLPQPDFDLESAEQAWFDAVEAMKGLKFIDSEWYINQALDEGIPILAEGAQGSLLDIDFGSYPFVTSSNTMAAGVCTGLGVAPSRIGRVWGIFKAYCTRVGSGPFPTELFDEDGERLRQVGHEFGATTGRPRRTGWLDLPTLKYSVMMNGVTDLIMMKSDVLDGFDTVKAAVAYRSGGQESDTIPYDTAGITPVYKEFPGWKTDLSGFRSYDALPAAFRDYVRFIETGTGCPVTIISVSPDRDAVILR
ncbi:MAG: adenylosuccinate synthase [Bacteroidales bacterium]|nr:adenylosuccinate synthase [Bacteroidales bacterium]